MWGFALISLLIRIYCVSAGNFTTLQSTQGENETHSGRTELNDLTEALNEMKVTEFGSFLDEMAGWVSSASDYDNEKSTAETILHPTEDGRKIKYKKNELKFIMKTLIVLKVVLGIVLPLGIIASKILSWKAVTLSLMAFMLAKILFIKNLLMGKNALQVTPTNFAPPVYIHGGPNEVFWKRQGDSQNVYPWAST